MHGRSRLTDRRTEGEEGGGRGRGRGGRGGGGGDGDGGGRRRQQQQRHCQWKGGESKAVEATEPKAEGVQRMGQRLKAVVDGPSFEGVGVGS